MYLSTIFKRKLLLAATLLCAGMLSMTAAKVEEILSQSKAPMCVHSVITPKMIRLL